MRAETLNFLALLAVVFAVGGLIVGLRALCPPQPGQARELGTWAIVCTHHKEDTSWMKQVLSAYPDIRLVVYECGVSTAPESNGRLQLRDKRESLVDAGAFYAYFDYAVRDYGAFPDHVVLLHGHDLSPHQLFSVVEIIAWLRGIIQWHPHPPSYINLGEYVFRDWVAPRDGDGGMVDMLRRTQNGHDALSAMGCLDPPNVLCELNAGQVYLARKRLLARSPLYWEALRDLTIKGSFRLREGEPRDYVLEGALHHIFGEPWVRPYVEERLEAWIDNEENRERDDFANELLCLADEAGLDIRSGLAQRKRNKQLLFGDA